MHITLSNTRLFRGIGADELPLLLQCLGAVQKHYDRGETILAEGAPTEQLGMVLSGMAMIGHDDIWGSHSLLGHVTPGEVFAEPYACIPGEPLRISVTAAEDTEVLFLNVGKVLDVYERLPVSRTAHFESAGCVRREKPAALAAHPAHRAEGHPGPAPVVLFRVRAAHRAIQL